MSAVNRHRGERGTHLVEIGSRGSLDRLGFDLDSLSSRLSRNSSALSKIIRRRTDLLDDLNHLCSRVASIESLDGLSLNLVEVLDAQRNESTKVRFDVKHWVAGCFGDTVDGVHQ